MNWFRKHWQGKYSLPVSYWANGFASGLVAFAAAMAVSFGAGYLYANSGTTNDQQQIANFGLTMGVLAYLPFIVWWTVGTWRSATDRGKGNFWSIFTKCVLVFLMILRLSRCSPTMDRSQCWLPWWPLQ
jgi:hypothetical protein